MKNTYATVIRLYFYLGILFLNSCQKMPNDEIFSGTYTTVYSGNTMKMVLISDEEFVSGTIVLNGIVSKLKAKSTNLSFNGVIFDEAINQEYTIHAIQEGEILKFSIEIPEPKQTLVFNFEKDAVVAISKEDGDKERNPKLVGTWRYTDVISSGSGDFYASLTTDYFFEFKPDGTLLSWTGKSGGGNQNVSLESGEGAVDKLVWYTANKTVYFFDSTTKQESQTEFYAEENRVMFSNGNSKRVYQRIR